MNAYIRVLHAIYGLNGVGIRINDYTITKKANFMFTSEYLEAYQGTYEIVVSFKGEDVFSDTFTVSNGDIKTICIAGTQTSPEIVEVNDSLENHEQNSTNSQMRFVNLVPTNCYDISIDELLQYSNVEFKSITEYRSYIPKTYNTKLYDCVEKRLKLTAPKTIMKKGYIYTSYIVGVDQYTTQLYIMNTLEGATYIK